MSLGIYQQKVFVSVYQGITVGNDEMKKKIACYYYQGIELVANIHR
jgi:hypothetical protein